MIKIGITGSIGMGKSTAAEMLRDMGVPIHDSDATVHVLLGPGGGGVEAVAKRFPDSLKIDAEGKAYIDRGILSRTVFLDNNNKKDLEEILHPLVQKSADKFMEHMKNNGHALVAFDIPLLFETNLDKTMDVTLCVSASKEKQKERVLARPNMIEKVFDSIVLGQMPDAEKRKRATHVIDSNKDFDTMRRQLAGIVDGLRLKGESKKKTPESKHKP